MHPVLAEIIGPDILVILAIVALLFGGSQIPKFARSLGSAKREFEQGLSEGDKSDLENAKRTAGKNEPERVTMTRRELDALLAEKEAAARRTAD